jgi:hypothetical protein
MAYQYNIIDNGQPLFEDLDEFVMQVVNTVATYSTLGDLGNNAIIDQAFSESNLAELRNSNQKRVLISVNRDNFNLLNMDFSETTVSNKVKQWSYAYDLYVRLDAQHNNQAKLERILDTLWKGLCDNDSDGQIFQLTLDSTNFSGNTYGTYLNQNKRLGLPIIRKEPFGDNTTYYTAILTILFKIIQL